MPQYNVNRQLSQRLYNQLLYYAKNSAQRGQQQSLPYVLLNSLTPNCPNNSCMGKSNNNSNSSHSRSTQGCNTSKTYNQGKKAPCNKGSADSMKFQQPMPSNGANYTWLTHGVNNKATPCTPLQNSNAYLTGKATHWQNDTAFIWETINSVGNQIKWNNAAPENIYLCGGKRYLVSFSINLYLEQPSICCEHAMIWLKLNNTDVFPFYGYGGNGCNPYSAASTFGGTYLVATPYGCDSVLSLYLKSTSTYCVDCAQINIVEL